MHDNAAQDGVRESPYQDRRRGPGGLKDPDEEVRPVRRIAKRFRRRPELGVKDLPLVIANTGLGGWSQKIDRRLGIMKAQAASAARPEFGRTAACVETWDFLGPGEESPLRHGSHWNCNAETYFLIDDTMSKAIIRLLDDKK
jgi:hypothetical protein